MKIKLIILILINAYQVFSYYPSAYMQWSRIENSRIRESARMFNSLPPEERQAIYEKQQKEKIEAEAKKQVERETRYKSIKEQQEAAKLKWNIEWPKRANKALIDAKLDTKFILDLNLYYKSNFMLSFALAHTVISNAVWYQVKAINRYNGEDIIIIFIETQDYTKVYGYMSQNDWNTWLKIPSNKNKVCELFGINHF